jgi:hypothetical protein
MLKKLPPPGRSFLFAGFDRISALKKVDFVQKPSLPAARTTCFFISGELSYLAGNRSAFPRRQSCHAPDNRTARILKKI